MIHSSHNLISHAFYSSSGLSCLLGAFDQKYRQEGDNTIFFFLQRHSGLWIIPQQLNEPLALVLEARTSH